MEINQVTESFMQCISALLFLTGILTAVTNIVVEVFKGLLPKLPTALLVFLSAEGITMASVVLLAAWTDRVLTWYYLSSAVILGIVVAYAAMGNFDKLKEIIEKIKNMKSKI